jgi:hypothetical protein
MPYLSFYKARKSKKLTKFYNLNFMEKRKKEKNELKILTFISIVVLKAKNCQSSII